MKFTKSTSTTGAWAKATELIDCPGAKIVSEAKKIESSFMDKNGNAKMQTVAKVKFQGKDEPLNVSLNRATVDALIDAFGEDSINWQGHDLRVQTEKVQIAGKNTRALYLIPIGYTMTEDANGYTVIIKEGSSEIPTIHADEEGTPNEIPF